MRNLPKKTPRRPATIRPSSEPAPLRWRAISPIESNNLQDVVWGGPASAQLFVACSSDGDSNRIQTSPDGTTWTFRSTPNANYIAIAWGGAPGAEKFVSVGTTVDGQRIIYSADGISWSLATYPIENNLYGVRWINGAWFAVGTDVLLTSPDGITWTQAPAIPSGTWRDIAYGGPAGSEVYVIVRSSASSNQAAYSSDLITWTQVSTGATGSSQGHRKIIYDGPTGAKRFVCVVDLSTQTIVHSVDGITWTPVNIVFANFSDVIYDGPAGSKEFVTVQRNSASIRVARSVDGITWSYATVTSPGSGVQGIAYGGLIGSEVFCCVSGRNFPPQSQDIRIATSPDLISWTFGVADTLPGPPANNLSGFVWGLAYGEEQKIWVAAASSGTVAGHLTSSDGVEWTPNPSSIFNAAGTRDIAYGGPPGSKVFVAGCTNGIYTSSDGIAWTKTHFNPLYPTAQWPGVVWGGPPGGEQFVAVMLRNNAGTVDNVAVSPDGITWTTYTVPPAQYWNITWGGVPGSEVYVAFLSGTGNVITSTDGITWSAPFATGLANLTFPWARFGLGKFVVASFGVAGYSVDGFTWNPVPNWASFGNYAIGIGGPSYRRRFIANGLNNYIYESEDAINWSQINKPTQITVSRFAEGPNGLLIGGGGGQRSFVISGWNV